jgi:hypothetical protein
MCARCTIWDVADEQRQERPVAGKEAIFRIPKTAYLAIAFLVFCMTPVALGEFHWLAVIYIFPLVLLFFVLRTRTIADSRGLTVRTMFGQRRLPWAALKGLVLTDKARVRAVLTDDTQITLPTVRTRHLPVLSLVSGGRLKDPTGLTTDMTESTGNSKASPQE